MVTIIELKKRLINAHIFCVIISKFSHLEKSRPIILLITDKRFEIVFNYISLLFGLAISLEIKDDKEP